MGFDIVIENGTVYDGSGATGARADVGIAGQRIEAVGALSGADAARRLDAAGMAVCPGFIDIHSHSDLTLIYNYRAESKLRQGVTTECLGQCGLGVHPVREADKQGLRDACSFICGAPVDWSWESTAEYIETLRAAGPSLNAAPMVSHGPVRARVMGFTDAPPTPEQLDQMCGVLQQSFDEGAVGLSFGLAYAPGAAATTEEVQALCRVAARNGKHVSVHIRNEGPRVIEALEEVIGVARELLAEDLRLRLQIDHLKTSGPRNWRFAEEALETVESAHAEGIDIAFDVYPYNVASRHLTGSFPVSMHAGGNEMLMRRLADREIRDAMRRQLADYEAGVSDHHPLEFEPELIQIVNLDTEKNRPLIGKFLSEIIEETGGDQIDTVLDLIIEENGHLDVALHSMDDANVERNLKHPLSMIGSDGFALAPYGALAAGRPHPRSYGTFPRFLGRYVREKGIMSLAEGIHKCTARSAARLNLSDRGLLREGYSADITIFNPETVIDRATFEQPHQYPHGVQWVIVNGVVSVEAGEHTGAGAGSILSN